MQLQSDHGLSQRERKTLQTFYRAFSANRPDLLEEAVTPDWEDIPLAPGQGPGPQGVAPIIAAFAAAFSDLQIIVDDVVGSGARIGVRARITGTHRGAFFGIAATHKPVSIAIHEFHEFDRDRIRRTWHLEDWFSMLHQLGAWPPARSLHPEGA